MIVIVDFWAVGYNHALGNAALLEMAARAAPCMPLLFVGQPSQIKAIGETLAPSVAPAVRFAAWNEHYEGYRHEVDVVKKARALLWLARTVGNQPTTILFSYTSGPLLGAFRLLRRFGKFGAARTVFMLHGNLAEIAGPGSSGRWWRRAFSLPRQLATPVPRTRYLVIEDAIRDVWVAAQPQYAGLIGTVPHHIVTLTTLAPPPIETVPLRVAFVGIATFDKGFPDYATMAQRRPAGVAFLFAGALHPQIAASPIDNITGSLGTEKIPRSEFEGIVAQAHYICLPYGRGGFYRFAASGSLFDAVALGRPLLALRTPLLDTLQQRYGPIGMTFDTIEALSDYVCHLPDHHDPRDYDQWRANLKAIADDRTPEKLAVAFGQSVLQQA
jgi:hypothetical protein